MWLKNIAEDAILTISLQRDDSSKGTNIRMAKVFIIPVAPDLNRKRRERTTDPRYVDGQRLLVEAMRYLAQTDPVSNRGAIELLSEHVRTRFRMSDSPLS